MKSTVTIRVQSYIDGGLDKDLIDPDNGENIARKRQKLGIDGLVASKYCFVLHGPSCLAHRGCKHVISHHIKKLDSKNISEISFEHAENGKVKKAHPKPFPQNYDAIPVKHCREQLHVTLKLANLSTGLSKPCAIS